MGQAIHDRGGWPTDEPIDMTEHALADWELLMDAIVGGLGARGVMNVDELRRGIESMDPAAYEAASYYERWLFAAETILAEKGVVEPGELEEQLRR
jgi:nitrile hydratase